MYFYEGHGSGWIGTQTAVVRWRLELTVIGHLSPHTVGALAREVGRRDPGQPVLVDLSGCAKPKAAEATLAVVAISGAAGDSPLAIVGWGFASVVGGLPYREQPTAWCASTFSARRWLSRLTC